MATSSPTGFPSSSNILALKTLVPRPRRASVPKSDKIFVARYDDSTIEGSTSFSSRCSWTTILYCTSSEPDGSQPSSVSLAKVNDKTIRINVSWSCGQGHEQRGRYSVISLTEMKLND